MNRKVFTDNLFMFKVVLRNIPFYVIGNLLLTISGAIINAYTNIYLIKYVVDAIQNNRNYLDVLVFILSAMGIFILYKAVESIFNSISVPKMTQNLNYKMQMELFSKAKEMDIEKYDDPNFYNDFILSMNNADTKAIEIVGTINTFIYNLTSITAMVTLIVSLDIIGVIFALINVVAAYFLNIRTAKLNYDKNIEHIHQNRISDYVGCIFYLPEYAKEIRMSGIKNVLMRYFNNAIDENKNIIKKYSKALTLCNFANYGFFRTFLMRGVYLLILVYKLVVIRAISFGSFMALFNGSWEFKNNLEAIIKIIPSMVENSLYVDKYRMFVQSKSKLKEVSGNLPMPNKPCEIEFRNVSFRYAEGLPYILKNVNFKINPCEKIAIYGLNGSGKSTLIKLLLRLYLVTEGEILLNGVNVNSYSLSDYYNYMGVIFQDFQLFSLSVAENVLLDKYQSHDEKKVMDMLCESNFRDKLLNLKNGVSTSVSKEFDNDGVDFSGGERQKIALARTMAKDFSVIIYDEPASALDPISEYEVNKTIWKSSQNKTVICISHRINTNVEADRVIYIKDGMVLEEDDELKLIYQ